MEIIIQETDKDILEILKYVLEIEGFQVYALLDGEDDILSLIDEYRPHVVMLDYRLDGKVCVAVLEKVKAKYPHLPVIAMSCNNNINEEYSDKGFDDYIPKPFNPHQLQAILIKHITRNTGKTAA